MPQTYYKTDKGMFLTIKDGKVIVPTEMLGQLEAGKLSYITGKTYSDVWSIAQQSVPFPGRDGLDTTPTPFPGRDDTVTPTPPPTPTPTPTPTGIYTIKSGDTLSGIASAQGTTVSALMAANPQITDPNLIYAGNNINIPQAGAPGQPGAPGVTPGEGKEVLVEEEEPSVPSLAFDLGDMITGEFTSEDLINIFSTPITEADIQKLLDENQKLRQQFLDSLKPSDVEIQLKSDLVDLRGEIDAAKLGYRKGVADIQQEMVSTRLMVGKEQELYTQAQLGMQTLAMQESNLLMRLGLEQDAREASSRVLAATLEFNDRDLSRMMTMQNQIWNQKMDMFNLMSQFSIRAQNTLNIVMEGLTGLDAGDMDSETVTRLQSLTKAAGIPWSVVQNVLKVRKDEYEYNRYIAALDRQLTEAKLEEMEGGPSYRDFTDQEKRRLEQAGIDWSTAAGYKKATDYLYGEDTGDVATAMAQFTDLIQQYKGNNYSKEEVEAQVRSENKIEEGEDIPGPYQRIIDAIYAEEIEKEGGWWEWYKKFAQEKEWYKPWTWLKK